MTAPTLNLRHLAVMRLRPGDALVFRHPGTLRPADAERIREQLAAALPEPRSVVIVLDGGSDLAILRQGGGE